MNNEAKSQNKTGNAEKINILKSRDDHKPVFFEKADDDKFKLCPNTECSWLKADDSFGPDKLRPRIEPWLTALVQSEYLSLLIGSGLTHAVHYLEYQKNKKLPGMEKAVFSVFQSQIDKASTATAKAAGRNKTKIRLGSQMNCF